MRFFSVFSASLLVVLAACGPSGEDSGESEPTSADRGESNAVEQGESAAVDDAARADDGASARDEDEPAGPIPARLLGAWASPSCGERTYARVLQFDDSGAFTGQDLVSPCPPKVTCIWSGVVNNSGTYTVNRSTITLDVAEPRAGTELAPFPTTLYIDPATSAPVEIAPSGEACVYERGNGTDPQQ